jgi:1-phosphofructokinase
VGAGDCTLFGYLLGSLRGLPAPDRLALAVAYGAAAAGLPGTGIPRPSDLHPERVTVQPLDPAN